MIGGLDLNGFAMTAECVLKKKESFYDESDKTNEREVREATSELVSLLGMGYNVTYNP